MAVALVMGREPSETEELANVTRVVIHPSDNGTPLLRILILQEDISFKDLKKEVDSQKIVKLGFVNTVM